MAPNSEPGSDSGRRRRVDRWHLHSTHFIFTKRETRVLRVYTQGPPGDGPGL